MAKRSKIQTEQTINQIMDEALKQILSMGFDTMSYTTLSEATGISRTGISHHFPKKTDFLVKLDARIGRLFLTALDFSSVDALERSWMHAMRDSHYRAIFKLFFRLCSSTDREISLFLAVANARDNAIIELGAVGEVAINQLIGRTALMLLADADLGGANQRAA